MLNLSLALYDFNWNSLVDDCKYFIFNIINFK